jgi:transposase
LRWRLVWLKLFYGMSNVDISSTLFVSPKTVSRIYRLFVTTGNVTSPKVFGRPKGTTTLYEHKELIICEILLRQPTIHLKEIAYEIENTTGTIDFLLRVFAGQYTGLDLQ